MEETESNLKEKNNSLMNANDNSKVEEQNKDDPNEGKNKNSNQFELFDNKLRSILFPEPIFSQYISELKNKPSKPVSFPNVLVVDEKEDKDLQAKDKTDTQKADQQKIVKPQYTRYLRTWKKNTVHTEKLTSYLSNLRELHLAKLITFIEQMHKNSQYTDLDLYVEDLCFPVHKLILACYAPFIFQKLERNRARKSSIERLRLINIDPQAFAIIIGYMYTGMVQPNETNFLPVLNTAVHLFMFDFANAWVELYEHKFTNRTAQLLFRDKIARQNGWNDYVQMLKMALAFDFEHLLISDQFEDIQFEQLRDILEVDNIGAYSEIVLYLAVLKWLNHDFNKRKEYALELMKQIRFNNMNENELYACYNPPILPEIIEIPEIKAMMADAFNLLVRRYKEALESEEASLNTEMNLTQKSRNYRLANAYKGQSLQLWRYLNSKKKEGSKCLTPVDSKDSKNLKELKEFKEFKEFKEKIKGKKTDQKEELDTDSQTGISSDGLKTLSKLSPTTSLESSPFNLTPSSGKDSTIDDGGKIEKKEKKSTDELLSNSTDLGNSISSDDQHKTKLDIIKTKPNINDSECKCVEIKHTTSEQCKRHRAAQIIQRSFKRFQHLKAGNGLNKQSKLAKKKLKSPKIIKPTLIGKKTMDKKPIQSIDSTESLSSRENESFDNLLKRLKDKSSTKTVSKDDSTEDLLKDTPESKSKDIPKDDRKKSIEDSQKLKDSRYIRRYKKFKSAKKDKSSPSSSEDKSSKESSKDESLDKEGTFDKEKHKYKLKKRDKYKEKYKDKLKAEKTESLQSSGSIKSEKTLTPESSTDQKEKKSDKKPKTRVESLILYSDPVNPDYCGFFICAGVVDSDGQLTGWKKNLQLDYKGHTKNFLPPYDTVIVSHGSNVYLVGGMQSKSNKVFYVSEQIFKYQLSNKKFQVMSTLKIPRTQHSVVVVGDRMYVICGCKKLNVPTNIIECVHLMSSKKLKLKSEMLKLPGYGRFGQSSVFFRNRLWMIGGIAKIDNNFHLLSEIWILDIQKDNKWIKSKFPLPIAFAGICSVNEEFIYVVGGRCVGLNGKLQPSEKVWCYSTNKKRWQQIGSLNQPRCNCCCVLFRNRIYTFGGSLENDAGQLRGQTGEYYELNNPNQGWKMLNKNLPSSISGQSIANIFSF